MYLIFFRWRFQEICGKGETFLLWEWNKLLGKFHSHFNLNLARIQLPWTFHAFCDGLSSASMEILMHACMHLFFMSLFQEILSCRSSSLFWKYPGNFSLFAKDLILKSVGFDARPWRARLCPPLYPNMYFAPHTHTCRWQHWHRQDILTKKERTQFYQFFCICFSSWNKITSNQQEQRQFSRSNTIRNCIKNLPLAQFWF